MQPSKKTLNSRTCCSWHSSGLSLSGLYMPRVQYCITRRHVRSGITRAVEPEHDDDQVVPQARKQQQQPLQPQQVPQSAAALNQQQEQRQQQQMASPSAANKQTPPQLQQQLQPVKQHQVQQQQAPLGQPQQQPPLQQQQPTQQQQMRSSAATPPTPSLRQQQQQHQQQKDSNHSRREPTWLQRIVAALQHMPAALVAFVFGGLGACLLLFGWAKGSPMRKNQPYTFSMSFQEASKVDVGTPVRMKGVQIGTVSRVALSPSHITAFAEVPDHSNVIPRTSRVDINLLGLAADPWIDITPPVGCLVRRDHGPHHADCDKDGLIVCDGGHIRGSQGGSTDFMMKFFLRQHDRTRQKTVDVVYHSRSL